MKCLPDSSAVRSAVKVKALELPGIRHGFFTREGGLSTGIYATNNCGYGTSDAQSAVTANRTACLTALGLQSLVTLYQRHTPNVVVVEKPWEPENAPAADAL